MAAGKPTPADQKSKFAKQVKKDITFLNNVKPTPKRGASKSPEKIPTKATADAVKAKISKIKEGPAPSNAQKVVKAAAKRVGTVAREVRDVTTAVGTMAKKPGTKAAANLGRQVKDVAKAAVTGKKGTTSDAVRPAKGMGLVTKGGESTKYRKGSQR